MSARGFYLRVLVMFAVASLVGLVIQLGFGRQAYRLYAWPVALLVILPYLSHVMATRMRTIGLRPRRRFWLLIPLFIIAVIRIVYWVLFFSTPELASMMHVVAAQISYSSGNTIYVPYALIVLLGLWYLVRLGFGGKTARQEPS